MDKFWAFVSSSEKDNQFIILDYTYILYILTKLVLFKKKYYYNRFVKYLIYAIMQEVFQ